MTFSQSIQTFLPKEFPALFFSILFLTSCATGSDPTTKSVDEGTSSGIRAQGTIEGIVFEGVMIPGEGGSGGGGGGGSIHDPAPPDPCNSIPSSGVVLCSFPSPKVTPGYHLMYGPGTKFEARFDIRASYDVDVSQLRAFLHRNGEEVVADTIPEYHEQPDAPNNDADEFAYGHIPLESSAHRLRFAAPPQELTPRRFRMRVVWYSPLDAQPSATPYKVGLRSLDSGTTRISNASAFLVRNTSWMRVWGDDDPNNISLAYIGDKWENMATYRDEVFRTTQYFFEEEPILNNYAPSFRLDAKRSIDGLSCEKCLVNGAWDPICGADPTAVTTAHVISVMAGLASLNPITALASFLVLHAPSDIAMRLRNSHENRFQCDVPSIRQKTLAFPNGADHIVVFTDGGEPDSDADNYWRSHVGTQPTQATDLIFAYLMGDADNVLNKDIVFLQRENTNRRSGEVLIHEFGHTFAKLPDFYDNDTGGIQGCAAEGLYGRMCTSALPYGMPAPAGWHPNMDGPNYIDDAVVLIDALNERVGQANAITTGYEGACNSYGCTFPNPNDLEDNCTARGFKIGYPSAPKQYSYLTASILDVQGHRLYSWASHGPVPRSQGSELSYFGYPAYPDQLDPDLLGPSVGLGYHGFNSFMEPLADGMYFFQLRHGDMFSQDNIGQKFTWVGLDRNLFPSSLNCSDPREDSFSRPVPKTPTTDAVQK